MLRLANDEEYRWGSEGWGWGGGEEGEGGVGARISLSHHTLRRHNLDKLMERKQGYVTLGWHLQKIDVDECQQALWGCNFAGILLI